MQGMNLNHLHCQFWSESFQVDHMLFQHPWLINLPTEAIKEKGKWDYLTLYGEVCFIHAIKRKYLISVHTFSFSYPIFTVHDRSNYCCGQFGTSIFHLVCPNDRHWGCVDDHQGHHRIRLERFRERSPESCFLGLRCSSWSWSGNRKSSGGGHYLCSRSRWSCCNFIIMVSQILWNKMMGNIMNTFWNFMTLSGGCWSSVENFS